MHGSGQAVKTRGWERLRVPLSLAAALPLGCTLLFSFWPERLGVFAHPYTLILSIGFLPLALAALWRGGPRLTAAAFSALALLVPMLAWLVLTGLGVEIPPETRTVYTWVVLLVALPLIWVPSGPMKAYITRRLLLIIPTFIGISLITFLVVQLAPGSPVYLKLAQMEGAAGGSLPQEVIDATKKLYGLDRPLPERYVLWLGRLVRLDFGNSYRDHRPVLERIFEALPVTLQLNLISIFLIYIISIPLGVYSATHQYSWQDNVITGFLFILYSLPSFWVAMLLMYFFGGGAHLNWFPVHGLSSIGSDAWPWRQWLFDRLWHLVLPVFCLTYAGFAYMSRYARAGVIESIRQDYIRTARAYGFNERTVVYRYALRNSLIPIITLLGTLLPAMIGGSVIIEYIFSVPGMGRLSFEAILSRDYPLVMGILSISAFLTLIGLIVSDTLYAIADPRIRMR